MARHRWQIAGLMFLTLICTAACNPLTLPYFLMVGFDPKFDAECPLSNGKEEVKVVILASAPLEIRPEFVGVEKELTSMLSQHLRKGFEENEENIKVASNSRVQRYLEDHPNWSPSDLGDMGRQLGTDFIIHLGVNRISLYEQGSRNQLYRGHADISVDVIDINKPGEDPIFRKEYSTVYPRSRGPVPISDMSLQKFKLSFLDRVATDLSWYFTAHSTSDEYHCD